MPVISEQAGEQCDLSVTFGIAIFDRVEIILAQEGSTNECVDHRLQSRFDHGPAIGHRDIDDGECHRGNRRREMTKRFRQFGIGEPRDPPTSQRAAFDLDHRGHESLVSEKFQREGRNLRPESDVVTEHHVFDRLFDDVREEINRGGGVDFQTRNFGIPEDEVFGVGNRQGKLSREDEAWYRLSRSITASMGESKLKGISLFDFAVLEEWAEPILKIHK